MAAGLDSLRTEHRPVVVYMSWPCPQPEKKANKMGRLQAATARSAILRREFRFLPKMTRVVSHYAVVTRPSWFDRDPRDYRTLPPAGRSTTDREKAAGNERKSRSNLALDI